MDQILFPTMAYGFAKPLDAEIYLLTDSGVVMLTDNGFELIMNKDPELRYTNPDLHRRIDEDAEYDPNIEYLLAVYHSKEDDPTKPDTSRPYKQSVKIGVFDYMHSIRLTETYIHDEESTTSEIP